MNDTEIIEPFIYSAEKLGTLPSSTILALICLFMGFYIWRKHKSEQVAQEKWHVTREEAVRAEEKQTLAFSKVVETMVMQHAILNNLTEKISHIQMVLDERLPRKV